MDQPRGGHRLAPGPGATTDQQARLAPFDLQQLAFARFGQDRLDHMLAFGQRCNLVQVGVGGLHGEILLEVFRRHQCVDETVLDLHGDVVFEMHNQRMEHLLAFTHVQGQRPLGTGRLFFQGDDLAAVAMTTGGNFVGDVMHFEQCRLALGLGDERADPLHAHQQTVGGHFPQGTVDGHAAETQLADQLAFRRHAVMRRPVSTVDLLGDHLFDAGVQGRRTVTHVCGQRRFGRRSRHGGSLFCE